MKTYEDWIGEAVAMLHQHRGRRERVAQALRERLEQDRELQNVLLGTEMPADTARARRMHERAVQGIYDLVDSALERINRRQ